MKKRVGALGALCVAAALLAAGCGGGSSTSGTTGATATGSATTASSGQTPSVSFAAPLDGAAVAGPVTAEVKLEGFTLNAAAVGKPAQAGEGHLHFSMDSGKFDFPKYSGANGQLAVKLGIQGKYSPSVTPTITYKDLPAGTHTLTVFLANNDHSNVGPTATTTFTVR